MTRGPGDARRDALARLIDGILRAPQRQSVKEIASEAGYSPYHLSRMFRSVTGERLGDFIRRLRLERAAHLLRGENISLVEAAVESGYGSPEAFGRAFERAFQQSPLRFRKGDTANLLASPNDLHWNPAFGLDVDSESRFPSHFELRLPCRAAVWRRVANYAHLDQSWRLYRDQFGETPDGRTPITIYRDTMWTAPVSSEMRADLGWIVQIDDEIPPGLRDLAIPGGIYRVTDHSVIRIQRNDVWVSMNGTWSGGVRTPGLLSFDEYDRFPQPFDQVLTRVVVGLGTNANASWHPH
jgi:AraC family transcriptional regulator